MKRNHKDTVERYLNMLNDLYLNLNNLNVTSTEYIKLTYSVSTVAAMMLVKLNIIKKRYKYFEYIGPMPSVQLVESVLKAQSRYIARKNYVK